MSMLLRLDRENGAGLRHVLSANLPTRQVHTQHLGHERHPIPSPRSASAGRNARQFRAPLAAHYRRSRGGRQQIQANKGVARLWLAAEANVLDQEEKGHLFGVAPFLFRSLDGVYSTCRAAALVSIQWALELDRFASLWHDRCIQELHACWHRRLEDGPAMRAYHVKGDGL